MNGFLQYFAALLAFDENWPKVHKLTEKEAKTLYAVISHEIRAIENQTLPVQ